MPVLAHKIPCEKCPFRRASARGYLGAASPKQFVSATLEEAEMPCHCSIDYEKQDWREVQYPTAALCAGSLVFLRNSCKKPREAALAKAVASVEPDRETVFSNMIEFVEYHGS